MITDCGFTNRSHTNRENSKSNLITKKNWENYKKNALQEFQKMIKIIQRIHLKQKRETCNKNTGE